MIKGTYEKILFVTKGEGVTALGQTFPEKANIIKFFHTSFSQVRFPVLKMLPFFMALFLWLPHPLDNN